MSGTGVVLDRAVQQLGGFLPRLAGAVVLLLLGILLARLVGRLITRLLRAGGADDLAERHGVHDVLARAGFQRSIARLVGRAIRLALTAVVIFAALSLLGLQFLSDSLNQAVLFLPKLLAAGALILVGIVLAGLVRERVDRLAYQMDFPAPLGQLAQIGILAIFISTAAAQIALATASLLILVAILIAAAAGAFALAFGLGGREVARALSAGRHIRGAFEVGQTITVHGIRGRIAEIETASTVLETPGGESVRVPNNLLLESVVTVHADSGPAEAPPPSP